MNLRGRLIVKLYTHTRLYLIQKLMVMVLLCNICKILIRAFHYLSLFLLDFVSDRRWFVESNIKSIYILNIYFTLFRYYYCAYGSTNFDFLLLSLGENYVEKHAPA